MRHLKIIGLLAIALAALMALAAGPAAATTVTTTTGSHAVTPTIHLVSEEKAVAGTNHILIHNEAANIECNSTIEGKIESHGAGVTAKGNVSNLQFTNCTNGWTVEVVNKGSLEIHWTSGYNGTLTSTGMTIRGTLHLGIFGTVECSYKTNNTTIGTITGGNPATLHIEAKLPKESSSSALCGGSEANWTGAYKTTEALYVASAATTGTVTSPTGTLTSGPIHWVSEEKAVPGTKHVLLHNETANIECESTVEGDLETANSGAIDNLTFTNCTNGWTVEVVNKGSLEIHWTSGYNGTLTSTGTTIATTLHLGIFGTVECNYKTSNTHIGTVTGGNPATLHLEGKIPKESGSAICGGSEANWTGAYKTTGALYVDN